MTDDHPFIVIEGALNARSASEFNGKVIPALARRYPGFEWSWLADLPLQDDAAALAATMTRFLKASARKGSPPPNAVYIGLLCPHMDEDNEKETCAIEISFYTNFDPADEDMRWLDIGKRGDAGEYFVDSLSEAYSRCARAASGSNDIEYAGCLAVGAWLSTEATRRLLRSPGSSDLALVTGFHNGDLIKVWPVRASRSSGVPLKKADLAR